MPKSIKDLTREGRYILSKKLVKALGTPAAFMLQQLHYWLSDNNQSYGLFQDGKQWIRNSYAQWQEQLSKSEFHLVILSISTIRRAFTELEKQGIVQSMQVQDYVPYVGGNQVKYFTINYDVLHNKFDLFIDHLQVDMPTERVFKMSTQGVQNEHPLYITNNTSKNTHFSQGSSASAFVNSNRAGEHSSFSTDAKRVVAHEERENLISEKNLETNCKKSYPLGKISLNPQQQNNSTHMLNFWIEHIENGKPIALTDNRARHLTVALKQYFENDVTKWEVFCLKIASSKFLMGEVMPFKASLDWVLKFDILQRILEGGYTFGDRVVNQTSASASPNSRTLVMSKDGEGEHALKIREYIRQSIGKDYYYNWFEDSTILCKKDQTGKAILMVPLGIVKDRIKRDYDAIVETFFEAVIKKGEAFPTYICLDEYDLSPIAQSHDQEERTQTSALTQQSARTCIMSKDEEGERAFKIREYIRQSIGEALYISWFQNTEIVCKKDQTGKAILIVPNRFMKDYIENHFRDSVEIFFESVIAKGEAFPDSICADAYGLTSTSQLKDQLDSNSIRKVESKVAHESSLVTLPVSIDTGSLCIGEASSLDYVSLQETCNNVNLCVDVTDVSLYTEHNNELLLVISTEHSDLKGKEDQDVLGEVDSFSSESTIVNMSDKAEKETSVCHDHKQDHDKSLLNSQQMVANVEIENNRNAPPTDEHSLYVTEAIAGLSPPVTQGEGAVLKPMHSALKRPHRKKRTRLKQRRLKPKVSTAAIEKSERRRVNLTASKIFFSYTRCGYKKLTERGGVKSSSLANGYPSHFVFGNTFNERDSCFVWNQNVYKPSFSYNALDGPLKTYTKGR